MKRQAILSKQQRLNATHHLACKYCSMVWELDVDGRSRDKSQIWKQILPDAIWRVIQRIQTSGTFIWLLCIGLWSSFPLHLLFFLRFLGWLHCGFALPQDHLFFLVPCQMSMHQIVVTLKRSATCRSLSFSRLNLSHGLLIPPVYLQFQLHCHYNQVVVTVDFCSRECSTLGSNDTGFDSLRCDDLVNLIVCGAIGWMPGCLLFLPIVHRHQVKISIPVFLYNEVFHGISLMVPSSCLWNSSTRSFSWHKLTWVHVFVRLWYFLVWVRCGLWRFCWKLVCSWWSTLFSFCLLWSPLCVVAWCHSLQTKSHDLLLLTSHTF